MGELYGQQRRDRSGRAQFYGDTQHVPDGNGRHQHQDLIRHGQLRFEFKLVDEQQALYPDCRRQVSDHGPFGLRRCQRLLHRLHLQEWRRGRRKPLQQRRQYGGQLHDHRRRRRHEWYDRLCRAVGILERHDFRRWERLHLYVRWSASAARIRQCRRHGYGQLRPLLDQQYKPVEQPHDSIGEQHRYRLRKPQFYAHGQRQHQCPLRRRHQSWRAEWHG